ncbi:MAG: HEAT repeat domain-containing protein [Planctomycetes bacterium]|nr:HEAT repeat domain-containing protein [Planctomycetota bacterium]
MNRRGVVLLFALCTVVAAQDKPSVDPEVAALVQSLGDAKARSRAAFELTNRGAAAVPALTAALTEPSLRAPALSVLGRIGMPAKPAVAAMFDLAASLPPDDVPPLLQAVADLAPVCDLEAAAVFQRLTDVIRTAQDAAERQQKPELRRQLRWEWKRTIERCGLGSKTPVDELVAALEHEDGFRRESAAYLLGRRGEAATTAIPSLLAALTGEHPEVVFWPVTTDFGERVPFSATVQTTAAEALVRIAPDAPAVVPAHVVRLRSADEATRRASAAALGAAGAAAAAGKDALLACLGDESPGVVREVVTALARIGIDAAVRERLAQLGEHPDAQVRATIAAVLRVRRCV